MENHDYTSEEAGYFFCEKKEVIYPYDIKAGEINMLMKNGDVQSYSSLYPNLNTSAEERTFLFYSRE